MLGRTCTFATLESQDSRQKVRFFRQGSEGSGRILLPRPGIQEFDRYHTSDRLDRRGSKDERASGASLGSRQPSHCDRKVRLIRFTASCTLITIQLSSSLDALKSRDIELLKPLATKFNLSYSAFGVNLSDKDTPAYGSLTLSEAFHAGLEPAPITPTDGETYQLFSGTIKATYNARRSLEGDNIAIAPSIMSGNTGKLNFMPMPLNLMNSCRIIQQTRDIIGI